MGILKKLFGFLFSDEPEFAPPSPAAAPAPAPAAPPAPPQTGGQEFESSIEIQYTNAQGEAKTFVGDASSIRVKGNHISLCVQPTGMRIALSRDRIGNPGDIDAVVGDLPEPDEARVLNYHKKRGTTSDLNEQLKQKYPNY